MTGSQPPNDDLRIIGSNLRGLRTQFAELQKFQRNQAAEMNRRLDAIARGDERRLDELERILRGHDLILDGDHEREGIRTRVVSLEESRGRFRGWLAALWGLVVAAASVAAGNWFTGD